MLPRSRTKSTSHDRSDGIAARVRTHEGWWLRSMLAGAFAVVLVVGSLWFSNPQEARAESSVPNSRVSSTQTFYTWVQAGETYSSTFRKALTTFSGVGNPVITVTAPSGTATTCTAITVAAPNGTTCAFSETAPVDGVYALTISNSDTVTTVTQTRVPMNWDISVAGAAGGRTWSENFRTRDETGAPVVDLPLWYLTPQGYVYETHQRGFTGINSEFAANAFGTVDAETCASLYHSIAGGGNSSQPSMQVVTVTTCPYTPFKIFFSAPDPALPADVVLPGGTSTWLNTPVVAPSISQLAFTPSAPGARSGTFAFTPEGLEGNVTVEIDVDGDGDFAGALDRSFPVAARGGSPVDVTFDGLDGAGTPIPLTSPLAARVIVDRIGEIHFVNGDGELLTGGIEVRRLNGPAGNETRIFWDDSPLLSTDYDRQAAIKCSTTPLLASGDAGASSAGGVHGWNAGTCTEVNSPPADTVNGGSWGNNRFIDDWAFIDVDLSTALEVPGVSLAKQSTPPTGGEVAPGDDVDYEVTLSAVRYPRLDLLPAGAAATEWGAAVSDDFSGVQAGATVHTDTLAASPDLGALNVSGTTWSWSGADVPIGSDLSVTYSATVTAEEGTLRNVAFLGTELPAVCTPGLCGETTHTITTAVIPPDPDPDPDGGGSGGGSGQGPDSLAASGADVPGGSIILGGLLVSVGCGLVVSSLLRRRAAALVTE